MLCYKVDVGGLLLDVLFLGRYKEGLNGGPNEYVVRGADALVMGEHGSRVARVTIEMTQHERPCAKAASRVTMSVSSLFDGRLRLKTRGETFHIGETDGRECVYPELQKKVDEHWGRIRKVIDLYVQNKGVLLDEFGEHALVWVNTLSDEERLYEEIWALNDVYADVFKDVIMGIAEELNNAAEELEAEAAGLE